MSLTGVDSHEYIMGGGAAIGLDVASLPQGMIFHFIHIHIHVSDWFKSTGVTCALNGQWPGMTHMGTYVKYTTVDYSALQCTEVKCSLPFYLWQRSKSTSFIC